MSDLVFSRDFAPEHGHPVAVAPGVRRVTAANPGPFTFKGTNSYIVGTGKVAIIDPGPADESQFDALRAATERDAVTHIILTHSHHDHADGAARLAEATGAPIHSAATLSDGAMVTGDDWQLETVATPGHASDHLVFALAGSKLLFSGDHVMGWSTTVVAPPDGSMTDYMASLDKLLARGEDTYLPGHGGEIRNAHDYVRALKEHRLAREAAIVDRLAAGDETIAAIVSAVYRDLDPQLVPAAGLSVLAHIEALVESGAVENVGAPGLDGNYRLNRR